jgi:hypothetical protein
MKKILLFGVLTFAAMGLFSNPIPDPEVHINEFAFTGSSGWNLEMYFYYCNEGMFDSITLQSGSGVARVIIFHGGPFTYFTDQDLARPLTINPNGDVIVLTAHSWSLGNFSCTLSFGNTVNPDVLKPSPGQSIARFEATNCLNPYNSNHEIFSLSDNPTMGVANDTTGTFGTIAGTVYDLNGQPVPNQAFYMDRPFTTDANGQYYTRVFSRVYSWDTICYEKWPGHFSPVKMSPVSYSMVPDSGITRDLHLLSELLVGTPPEPKLASSVLTIFPNPVADAVVVSYSTGLTAQGVDLRIYFYDMNGKMVLEKVLENNLGVITIPFAPADGVYIAMLRNDTKILGSTRFIVDTSK